jgi:hypothetical protein
MTKHDLESRLRSFQPDDEVFVHDGTTKNPIGVEGVELVGTGIGIIVKSYPKPKTSSPSPAKSSSSSGKSGK